MAFAVNTVNNVASKQSLVYCSLSTHILLFHSLDTTDSVLCAACMSRIDQVRHYAGVPVHGEYLLHCNWALLLLEAG